MWKRCWADSGIGYIILQPGTYTENLLGPWTRPFVAEKDELPYPVPEALTMGWIASDDLGKLMVAALEQPHLANNKFVVSGTQNVTGPELAAEFSKGLGREINYRFMPLDEFAAIIDQAFGPGAGEMIASGYRFQNENRDILDMWVNMEPVLNQLEVEMSTLAGWAQQYKMAFS